MHTGQQNTAQIREISKPLTPRSHSAMELQSSAAKHNVSGMEASPQINPTPFAFLRAGQSILALVVLNLKKKRSHG